MDARRLTSAQVQAAVLRLPGWAVRGKSLHKEFKFLTFRKAWAFMSRVARAAEAMDHHPDWSNSYGKVVVGLSTHSKGGITNLDVALARKIERLGGGAQGAP